MGWGELPTSLAEAEVQGAAEHPIGLSSRSSVTWIFKVHVGFICLFCWVILWSSLLPWRRSGHGSIL